MREVSCCEQHTSAMRRNGCMAWRMFSVRTCETLLFRSGAGILTSVFKKRFCIANAAFIYRSFVACHLIIPAAATTAVPWRCLHPGFWLSRLAGPPVLWQTSISAFTELRIILVSAVCSNIILMMKIYGRLWLLFFCTSNYNYIELQSNLDITNMGITKFAI